MQHMHWGGHNGRSYMNHHSPEHHHNHHYPRYRYYQHYHHRYDQIIITITCEEASTKGGVCEGKPGKILFLSFLCIESFCWQLCYNSHGFLSAVHICTTDTICVCVALGLGSTFILQSSTCIHHFPNFYAF